MAINAYGNNLATNGAVQTNTNTVEDKTALGKDDFMTLLLVELQHQDPTEPMDSEKILTQTSQLAGLEASENTNKALEDLAASLKNSQEFSTIAAIGKRADLGSDAIAHEKNSESSFEMYFSEEVHSGVIEISDFEGNVVATMPIEQLEDEDGNRLGPRDSGVYQFDWDGVANDGSHADTGNYRINAKYVDSDGEKYTSRIGAYPIESVRFEGGKTLLKLGSSYIPLENVVEIY